MFKSLDACRFDKSWQTWMLWNMKDGLLLCNDSTMCWRSWFALVAILLNHSHFLRDNELDILLKMPFIYLILNISLWSNKTIDPLFALFPVMALIKKCSFHTITRSNNSVFYLKIPPQKKPAHQLNVCRFRRKSSQLNAKVISVSIWNKEILWFYV